MGGSPVFLLTMVHFFVLGRRWKNENNFIVACQRHETNISPETRELDQENSNIGECRHHGARKDLIEWLMKANLPYHSPHRFRHGHAVFAIKHAKNMAQLKAISQNLMHANISITDGIYGGLSDSDINEQISSLTNISLQDDKKTLLELLRQNREIIEMLEYKLK